MVRSLEKTTLSISLPRYAKKLKFAIIIALSISNNIALAQEWHLAGRLLDKGEEGVIYLTLAFL